MGPSPSRSSFMIEPIHGQPPSGYHAPPSPIHYGLVAEQLGEPQAPPARAPERVILHGFGLDRRLHVAHLLAQLADLAAIAGEFFCGVFVAHGFTPHTKVLWRELSTTSWPGSCPVGHLTRPRTRPAPSPSHGEGDALLRVRVRGQGISEHRNDGSMSWLASTA